MTKSFFGNENFNLENFGWRTFDPGRDLEIEILEDENFHENGRTIIFLVGLAPLQLHPTLFPLVQMLLGDRVSHLSTDIEEHFSRGVEVKSGDVEMAEHGQSEFSFEDSKKSV